MLNSTCESVSAQSLLRVDRQGVRHMNASTCESVAVEAQIRQCRHAGSGTADLKLQLSRLNMLGANPVPNHMYKHDSIWKYTNKSTWNALK